MYKHKRKLCMLIYIVLVILFTLLGVWYYHSLDVDRAAQDTPFFDVFPEAERNPSSYQVGSPNADMFFFGAKGEAYYPFTKEERTELRDILSEIRITNISEENESTEQWLKNMMVWWNNYGTAIGFRKYSMSLIYIDVMPVLCFFDVRTEGQIYYIVENWSQAELLHAFIERMEQKYEPIENKESFLGIWIGWRFFFYEKLCRYQLHLFLGGMTAALLLGLGIIWLYFRRKEKKVE